MSLTADATAILEYLREYGNDGEANASDIRDGVGFSLARVNKALDALRRGGEVVEMTSVQDKHGDSLDVWEVKMNRGWAKIWCLRSTWNRAVLPNGREPLPDDVKLPAGFRANWEAP